MPRIYRARSGIEGGRAEVDQGGARYLKNVLRLRAGDEVEVFDGGEGRWRGRIVALGARGAEIALDARLPPLAPSPARITLAQVVPKGLKLDGVVRAATELGAAHIVPLLSHRSVTRPAGAALGGRLERWRRIAVEAARQCGRTDLPQVETVRELKEFLSMPLRGVGILLWEGERVSSLDSLLARENERSTSSGEGRPGEVTLLVGPEGGFTGEEVELARHAGYHPVTLGGRILRCETAGIAAVAILQFALGDLGGPVKAARG